MLLNNKADDTVNILNRLINNYLNISTANISTRTGNLDTENGTYIINSMNSEFNGNVPNLGGNRFLIIGFSKCSNPQQGPEYGVQLAIGFGSDKIAIRYATYQSYTWSAWRII
jgi:hypothetical protein